MITVTDSFTPDPRVKSLRGTVPFTSTASRQLLCYGDAAVFVFDLLTTRCESTLHRCLTAARVRAACLSQNELLACVAVDDTCMIFDVGAGSLLQSLPFGTLITTMVSFVDPQRGQLLLVGTALGEVHVVDLSSLAVVRKMQLSAKPSPSAMYPRQQRITSIAVAAGRGFCISMSEPAPQVIFYALANNMSIMALTEEDQVLLETQQHTAVEVVAFSPNGEILACGCRSSGVIVCFSVTTKKAARFPLCTLSMVPGATVTCLKFAGPRHLLAALDDRSAFLWDVEAQIIAARLPCCAGVHFSAVVDGHWLFCSPSSNEITLVLLRLPYGAAVETPRRAAEQIVNSMKAPPLPSLAPSESAADSGACSPQKLQAEIDELRSEIVVMKKQLQQVSPPASSKASRVARK
jgi:WD40 repeat protein